MRALASRSPVPTSPTQAPATVRSKYNRRFPDGLGQAIGGLAGGSLDAAGTALKDVGNIVDGLTGTHSAAPPSIPSGGGKEAPSASGGWISTHPEPQRPTYAPPASGGDAGADPPLPARSQDPHAHSSVPEGAATAVPLSSTRRADATQKLMSSSVPGSADDGQTADIARPSPSNTASAPSGGADGHGKRFAPVPAPAAALVCVLGLLVLCAAVWLYRIKRRLRAVCPYARSEPEMCPVSATTVSTMPLFVRAREERVVDENPFLHPHDADADDQFHARASRWSASTTRSASTISVRV